jgi:type IV secretory pathway TraG/TraD family ATPase VirD4
MEAAVKSAFFFIAIILSYLSAFFAQTAGRLHTARFARLHEFIRICLAKADSLRKMPVILIGYGPFNRVFCVRPTKTQKELANVLIYGKTRIGKGLNITTNLLTWPFPVIVNDIKREFWDQTSAWRQTGLSGRSLIFDPRGYGNTFDPLAGRTTDSDLRSAAKILLHRPDEGQNAVFTERAITMLTQIFHAAKLERQRALPFAYKILNEGLYGTATILKIISDKHTFYPHLATKFLDISYEQADFDSKFLQDCYSTMSARINNILTKETVRCFTGSDFTGRDIITSGDHPVSLYLCWPERDVLTLSPLIELVWDCLINDMVDAYDAAKGEGCSRTLLVLDEIFRSGMRKLPEYATTVCGRNISILLSAQSRSQLEAHYGIHNARVLRGQMDTILIHRPAPDDFETMQHIETLLGYTSGYAHSKSEHAGGATTTGESEQKIPLIPAHETDLIGETEVIIKRSGIRPILAERLDWRRFPELEARYGMPPSRVAPLPAFEQHFTKGQEYAFASGSSWQLSPELTRRGRPLYAGNGFSQHGRGAA